jgi:quinol monooxygenase YgiN
VNKEQPMSTIIITAHIQIQPAKRAKAIEIAQQMSAASEQEAGCRRYRFWADLADANTFFLFEEWENQEALDHHFQTPHMATFQQHLPELLAAAPVIHKYTIAAVGAL